MACACFYDRGILRIHRDNYSMVAAQGSVHFSITPVSAFSWPGPV